MHRSSAPDSRPQRGPEGLVRTGKTTKTGKIAVGTIRPVIADEPMRLAIARAAPAVPTGTASLASASLYLPDRMNRPPRDTAERRAGRAIVADVTQDEATCAAAAARALLLATGALLAGSDEHLDRIPRELVGAEARHAAGRAVPPWSASSVDRPRAGSTDAADVYPGVPAGTTPAGRRSATSVCQRRRRSFALTTPSAKTNLDMSSQFHSGETVRLVRSSLRCAADGDFKIVRSLPDDGGETQYRIRACASRTIAS
jgi:hypothetical protein